jgi:hypothetical protein
MILFINTGSFSITIHFVEANSCRLQNSKKLMEILKEMK